MVQGEYLTIVAHLLLATVAGAMIGYERSYQGRPAGFRTHTLVCIASALLMLLAIYQDRWFAASAEIVRVDPTRMAQGIMTGIGFLGAGVIVKDGASVRGLTTAASIWITAAIGVLAGTGFYFAVVIGTALTLGTLSMFRWIEARMPALSYMQHTVRFPLERAMPEMEYRDFVKEHGLHASEFSYRVNVQNAYTEYHMVLSSRDVGAERRLAAALSKKTDVIEFRLAPSGD
ncbi:MAG TPA: MgtC/SapB family protein [Burkholderiales bacterium]|nr:MgtC/SapB family protein [Burkholderiales bacterium]